MVVDQNIVDQKVVDQKVVDQKIVHQKLVDQMVVDQKVVDHKVVDQQIVHQKLVDHMVVDQKVVDQKVVDQKVVDHVANFRFLLTCESACALILKSITLRQSPNFGLLKGHITTWVHGTFRDNVMTESAGICSGGGGRGKGVMSARDVLHLCYC